MAKAPIDALRTLEHATTLIVSALVSKQADSGSLDSRTTVTFSSMPDVRITLPPRNVGTAEVEEAVCNVAYESDYAWYNKKGSGRLDEQSVADKFAAYLGENTKPCVGSYSLKETPDTRT